MEVICGFGRIRKSVVSLVDSNTGKEPTSSKVHVALI